MALPCLLFGACFLGSGLLLSRYALFFASFRVGLVGCLNSFSLPEFPEASPCAARTLGGLKHRLGSAGSCQCSFTLFWWAPLFKLQADSKTWRCL